MRNAQIGLRFWMMSIQDERAFIIQDGSSKVAGVEISVPEIVEQICAPHAFVGERFVTIDCFLEMTRRIFLVRLRKLQLRLR
jgi:hypothetical protein